MKKILALLLVLVMVFALCACGQAKTEEPKAEEAEEVVVEETPAEEPAAEEPAAEEPAAEEPAAEEPAAEEPGVLSYAQFLEAEEGAQITVEAYVQATQSWWDNKITVYAQEPEGGYFIYEMACTEDDSKLLVPGAKIRVTGDKAVWNGLVEITDPTFEFVEADPWVAEALDIGELLGTEELAAHMNEFICVKDAVVADKGEGAAFFFNWDNSGEDGKCDLYFDVEVNGGTYTFVVRRYLTAPGSEVYEAVKNLNVGDTVDIEGFLYWYEGPQPHITSIIVK